MAADNEMTIVVRAKDQATSVLKSIGSTIINVMRKPLDIVLGTVKSIYKQFFSLKSLLLGGGILAAINGLATGLSRSSEKFEVVFGEKTQSRIDAVASSFSKFKATIQATFGSVLATFSDDIVEGLDAIGHWFATHKDQIINFIKGLTAAIREVWKLTILALYALKNVAEFIFSTKLSAPGLGTELRKTQAPVAENPLDAMEIEQAVQATHALNQEYIDWTATIQQWRKEADLEELSRSALRASELVSSFANGFTDAFESIVDGTKTVGQAFADMATSILRDISRLLVNRAISSLLGGLFGGAGLSGVFGNDIGARAGGGPVSPGGTYVVGEHGPEILRMGPGGGGYVSQRGSASGGSVTVQNIFNGPADPREVERRTTAAVMRALEMNRSFRKAVQVR